MAAKLLKVRIGSAVAGAALALVFGSAVAVPLSAFEAFGTGAGDNLAAKCDDCSTTLNTGPLSWRFYGNTYSTLFLNNNGNVTFGAAVSGWDGSPFPVSSNPMIAPFWADVDTRGSGIPNNLWYRTTTNASDLASMTTTVRNAYLGEGGFSATQAFVATWDQVGYYSAHTNPTNTFQLEMISDGVQNFAVFNYLDNGMGWLKGDVSSTNPSLGFDAGNGVAFYNLPGSNTSLAAIDAMTMSNTIPAHAGQWIFRIDDNIIVAPPTVPEPASAGLVGLGLLGLGFGRRRRASGASSID